MPLELIPVRKKCKPSAGKINNIFVANGSPGWLVGQAVSLGHAAVLAAAAILLTFDAYLRPSEALGLECRHVTPPRRGASVPK